MKRRQQVAATLALIALAAIVPAPFAPLHAQEVLKVGIIGQFTGPFAVTGEQYKQGLDSYLAQNGAVASGRKLELVYRDTGGPNPAQAKRLAEELLVRDKVSILGGLYLSPEAAAAAPAVNETRTPALLFNAAGWLRPADAGRQLQVLAAEREVFVPAVAVAEHGPRHQDRGPH